MDKPPVPVTGDSIERGGLSGNLKGAIWMIASGVGFTLHTVLARDLSADLHPVAIAFWRSFLALAIAAPLIVTGHAKMRLVRFRLVFIRSLFGTFGFIFSMLALWDIYALPFAEFSALSFTRPLFVTILAGLVLRERVGPHRWAAVLAGFIGVLVMVGPGLSAHGGLNIASIYTLASAFCFAGAIILVKSLTADHTPLALLIWANLLSSVMLSVIIAICAVARPDWAIWSLPSSGAVWGLVALMALTGLGAQFAYITATSIADVSFVSPMDYLRLPMATVADWIIIRTLPGPLTWVGAAVIVVATLYITLREARLKRARAIKPPL